MTSLREPAHLVSEQAPAYWRTTALIGTFFVWVAVIVTMILVPERPWWAWLLVVLLLVGDIAHVIWMPRIRFRIHRWQVTPTAVHTRSGWINREERIAPLSRVQTVDSEQSALMRLFGLASITVTTASAAGPITISCLDHAVAQQVVAELTEITGQSEGDAT